MSSTSKKGGNHNAAGRASSFSDEGKIVEWLTEHINSSDAFSYTTERKISATNKEILLTPKYQKLFLTGMVLSPTWAFRTASLTSAMSAIAQEFFFELRAYGFIGPMWKPLGNLQRLHRAKMEVF